MTKWNHNYGTLELAMRIYAHVHGCQAVAARRQQMALERGEHMRIADDVAAKFGCSRSTAARHVRAALDVLGFGEPIATRDYCGVKKPGKRIGRLEYARRGSEARA